MSLPGLFSIIITLLIVLGSARVSGGSMFSPGPLRAESGGGAILGGVEAHAELGGSCRACHAPFWGSDDMAARCLQCHQDTAAELLDPESLHGALTAGAGRVRCHDCHTEHEGLQAPLTVLDPDSFPHQATGFSLAAHRSWSDGEMFACKDCHVDRLSSFDPDACSTCHRDLGAMDLAAHIESFGSACLACHDGLDTLSGDFDHGRTSFALTGGHASPGCAACHAGAQSIAEMAAAPRACLGCHAADDPHRGRFGTDCAACHTPEGWTPADFNHDRTDFPLVGGHADVACQACHTAGEYAGTPISCIACHAADDAHQGQYGQDCAACHTPAGWDRATFDHSLAAFPLTGAHVEVACSDCHLDGAFVGTPTTCAACHQEPDYHLGLFEARCETCHTSQAWRPAQYDRPHTFPFNHGEEGINTCQTCHPSVLQRYDCYQCHEHDPGEVEREHREEGITDFLDCTRCHPTGLKGEFEGDD